MGEVVDFERILRVFFWILGEFKLTFAVITERANAN